MLCLSHGTGPKNSHVTFLIFIHSNLSIFQIQQSFCVISFNNIIFVLPQPWCRTKRLACYLSYIYPQYFGDALAASSYAWPSTSRSLLKLQSVTTSTDILVFLQYMRHTNPVAVDLCVKHQNMAKSLHIYAIL